MAELTQGEAARNASSSEQAQKGESGVKNRFQAYRESVQKMKESFESLQETKHKSQQAMKEANAETQAAQSDGVVSPFEAMELINEEAYAKKVNRRVERKALAQSASYFTQSLFQGVRTVWNTSGSVLDSAIGTVTDKKSWGTLAAGAVLGGVFGDGPIADVASNWAGTILGLKGMDLDDGVEEKAIPGFSTEEEQLAYAAGNAGGEPSGHTDPGDGSEPASEKEVPGGTRTYADTGDDALNTSSDEFDRMSRIGDSLTEFLQNSDNPVMNILGSAIATPGGQDLLKKTGSTLMEQLNSRVSQMDADDPTAGVQAPDFDDIP